MSENLAATCKKSLKLVESWVTSAQKLIKNH